MTLAPDRLTMRGGKSEWSYTLNEPAQGRITVRLTVGTALQWCAEAEARRSGKPPSTARNDRTGRFKSASKTAPPALCPPPPG
jgi:hypothetical protein